MLGQDRKMWRRITYVTKDIKLRIGRELIMSTKHEDFAATYVGMGIAAS